MIDSLTEELIPLSEAVQLLPRPRRGKKRHFATVWRWAIHGVRGVRLEVLPVGGSLHTSRPAIQRFFERLAAARGLTDSTVPTIRTRRQREAAIRRAEQRLAKRGIFVRVEAESGVDKARAEHRRV